MEPFEGKPTPPMRWKERIIEELLYRPKEHYEHKSLIREFVSILTFGTAIIFLAWLAIIFAVLTGWFMHVIF